VCQTQTVLDERFCLAQHRQGLGENMFQQEETKGILPKQLKHDPSVIQASGVYSINKYTARIKR